MLRVALVTALALTVVKPKVLASNTGPATKRRDFGGEVGAVITRAATPTITPTTRASTSRFARPESLDDHFRLQRDHRCFVMRDATARVLLAEPTVAAPGQAAMINDGDRMLAGGWLS